MVRAKFVICDLCRPLLQLLPAGRVRVLGMLGGADQQDRDWAGIYRRHRVFYDRNLRANMLVDLADWGGRWHYYSGHYYDTVNRLLLRRRVPSVRDDAFEPLAQRHAACGRSTRRGSRWRTSSSRARRCRIARAARATPAPHKINHDVARIAAPQPQPPAPSTLDRNARRSAPSCSSGLVFLGVMAVVAASKWYTPPERVQWRADLPAALAEARAAKSRSSSTSPPSGAARAST